MHRQVSDPAVFLGRFLMDFSFIFAGARIFPLQESRNNFSPFTHTLCRLIFHETFRTFCFFSSTLFQTAICRHPSRLNSSSYLVFASQVAPIFLFPHLSRNFAPFAGGCDGFSLKISLQKPKPPPNKTGKVRKSEQFSSDSSEKNERNKIRRGRKGEAESDDGTGTTRVDTHAQINPAERTCCETRTRSESAEN